MSTIGPDLRPEAAGLKDMYGFLRDLGLDADVNLVGAALGTVAPDRLADPDAFRGLIDRLGLRTAMAGVLEVDASDVKASLVVRDEILNGDVDEIGEHLSAHHQENPLRLDEPLRVVCWPHRSGRHAVFVKLNHLLVDRNDAVLLVDRIRAHLAGGPEELPGDDRYRGHAAALARYASLECADPVEVAAALGPVPVPVRRGVPTISSSASRWLPVREGLSFDHLLATVADVLSGIVGPDLVLQYPFSIREFAELPGYYAQIRPIVVRGSDSTAPTREWFRATRKHLESLGKVTMSDLDGFSRAFTRGRMPRIVVSDTTFLRPDPARWEWIPVLNPRTFEDLKFLLDRSWPGPPLLCLQYKPKFLDHESAASVLAAVDERIGTT